MVAIGYTGRSGTNIRLVYMASRLKKLYLSKTKCLFVAYILKTVKTTLWISTKIVFKDFKKS